MQRCPCIGGWAELLFEFEALLELKSKVPASRAVIGRGFTVLRRVMLMVLIGNLTAATLLAEVSAGR